MRRFRRQWDWSLLAAVAAVALAAGAAVGGGQGGGGSTARQATGGSQSQHVSFLARIVPPPPQRSRREGPRVPRSIADLVSRLPLERKVAQLFLWGFEGKDLTSDVFTRLKRLDVGGLVFDRRNYSGPQPLGQLAGEALAISQRAQHVPPWIMAQQEGGEFNAFPDLPPQDAPVDLNDAGTAGLEAAQAAATLRPLGVDGIIGPVLDVGSPEGGAPALGDRVYSDVPGEVAGYAGATVSAYRKGRMIAAVEHFPGLGAASQDTQQGPATVGLSLPDLKSRDLVPFEAAFQSGAPAVVLSSALYQMDNFTQPGSLSRQIDTDLLRRKLRFTGMAITDDLEDPAITTSTSVPEAAVRALKAGADMVWISGPASDQQAAYVAVLRAAQRRDIPPARLDEALSRVLITKRDYGLIQ